MMAFTLPTLIQVFLIAYVIWSFLEMTMKCRHPLAQMPFYLLLAWYVVIFYTVVDYQLYDLTIVYRGNHIINALGILLFLGSSGLRFMVIRTLKGVDDPDKPVNKGLFAVVRYPLFTAYLLQLAGITICFGSAGGFLGLVLLCIPLIFIKIREFEKVIPFDYEEETAIYRKKVGARLVPGIW